MQSGKPRALTARMQVTLETLFILSPWDVLRVSKIINTLNNGAESSMIDKSVIGAATIELIMFRKISCSSTALSGHVIVLGGLGQWGSSCGGTRGWPRWWHLSRVDLVPGL